MRAEQVAVSADGSAFRCRELVGRDLWRVLRGRVCGTLAVAEVGAGAARAASPLASPVSQVVPPLQELECLAGTALSMATSGHA